MKALFISTHFPEDFLRSATGTFKRLRTFLDALKERASLRLLFYCRPELQLDAGRIMEAKDGIRTHWGLDDFELVVCRQEHDTCDDHGFLQRYLTPALSIHRQLGYARTSGDAQLRTLNACLDDNPQLIFAHRLNTVCPLLRTDRPLPPVYMDLDDVEHKVFLREMSQPPKWASKPLMYLQWPALMLGERRAIQLTRKTFVCSDADVRYLRRTLGLSNVSLIPNSIDIPAPQPTSGEPALLFLGAYGYKPNVVAATELIREIWPFVRSACPAARLIIAGASPERIPCFAEHHEGVEYAGFVEDLDQIYRRARAVCCPIRSGGGTRIKIIEAAAYGKAIVSTPLGAEGLDFTDGSEIMLRDDPGAFAAACIELLRNDRLCERIGAAARARATARYDRQSVIRLVQGEIFGSSAEETQTGREARSDNTEKPNAANV